MFKKKIQISCMHVNLITINSKKNDNSIKKVDREK